MERIGEIGEVLPNRPPRKRPRSLVIATSRPDARLLIGLAASVAALEIAWTILTLLRS
jgi:hypothetical protein